MNQDIPENDEKLINQNIDTDIIDQLTKDVDNVVPQLNIGMPENHMSDVSNIVKDEELVEMYKDIIGYIKDDRCQIDTYIDNFANMVMNDGDATSSTKEALVNLIKIKSDMSDKMSKVADLMTRIKLKERDTFPKYLAAQQNNTINIGNNGNNSRRSLIEALNKAKTKKE
jgi:hypothetical protein